MKKIGILGSGIVAKTLGNGFLRHGYEVMLGSRDVSKLAEWKASGGQHAHTGSFADAAAFGELLVLAVKGDAALDALGLAGAQNLTGKTIIDTTNPIDHTKQPVNGVLPFFSEINHSLMERLQAAFPDTHFVKAFSCVGNPFMVNPTFPGGSPSMFICGNSDHAKQQVSQVLSQFGWNTEDMGKAESARAIEPLCMLWCIPGFLQGKWNHAFTVVRA